MTTARASLHRRHPLPSIFLIMTIFSSSFLTALSSRPFPSQPVLGTDGKELKLGKPYYVFSTLLQNPQGLCLVDNAACPDDVVQCPSFYAGDLLGLPVTFSPISPSEDTVVREDTPYHIQFPPLPGGNCSDETGNLWYVKDDPETPNKEFVAIGPESLAVEFKIQRVLVGYKIVYCVLIPIPPTPVCYGIGLIWENGYNRLGIGLGVNLTQFFFTNNVTHHRHHHLGAGPDPVDIKLASHELLAS
ncbi:hypothetical protein DM860_008913 [Cuscuta australis]|uniref:Uncharacterized protein n=1 Tax=Cuscuta australis TaxID=267555 RepID=A0A328DBQ6_9ASTE|nr:hypothetical protein DM860_008913 [Cuscuta australis]